MSVEYEEFIPSNFNDKFYILLNGPESTGGETKVINTTQCSNEYVYYDVEEPDGSKSCYISIKSTFSEPCPDAATNIDGTGFECAPTRSMDDMTYGSSTGWLTTQWKIAPGEKFTLTFHIHDTQDAIFDSMVLLDNFRFISQEGSVSNGTVTSDASCNSVLAKGTNNWTLAGCAPDRMLVLGVMVFPTAGRSRTTAASVAGTMPARDVTECPTVERLLMTVESAVEATHVWAATEFPTAERLLMTAESAVVTTRVLVVTGFPTAARPWMTVVCVTGTMARRAAMVSVIAEKCSMTAVCAMGTMLAGCDGVPNSGKTLDDCGVCDGGNGAKGCDGVCYSGKTVDGCGVCGGNNACAGCDGVPNSGKTLDDCGVCGGNNSAKGAATGFATVEKR